MNAKTPKQIMDEIEHGQVVEERGPDPARPGHKLPTTVVSDNLMWQLQHLTPGDERSIPNASLDADHKMWADAKLRGLVKGEIPTREEAHEVRRHYDENGEYKVVPDRKSDNTAQAGGGAEGPTVRSAATGSNTRVAAEATGVPKAQSFAVGEDWTSNLRQHLSVSPQQAFASATRPDSSLTALTQPGTGAQNLLSADTPPRGTKLTLT
jgi:hypothetical protein